MEAPDTPTPSSFGLFNLCREFTYSGKAGGTCPRGSSCPFAHIVQLQAVLPANGDMTMGKRSTETPSGTATVAVAVAAEGASRISSIAVRHYFTHNPRSKFSFKILTASHDGVLRLWKKSETCDSQNCTTGTFKITMHSTYPWRLQGQEKVNGTILQCNAIDDVVSCTFEQQQPKHAGVLESVVKIQACRIPFLSNQPLPLPETHLPIHDRSNGVERTTGPKYRRTTTATTATAGTATTAPTGAESRLPCLAHKDALNIITAYCSSFFSEYCSIITGSRDGNIQLWKHPPLPSSASPFEIWTRVNPISLKVVRTLHGHAAAVTDFVCPSHPRNVLWSSSNDHCIRVWSLSTGANLACITSAVPPSPLHTVRIHARPPSPTAATQLYTDSFKAMPNGHCGPVTALMQFNNVDFVNIAPIVSASLDGTAKLWDIYTGDCWAVASHSRNGRPDHPDGITCLAETRDFVNGHRLVLLGSSSGAIYCRNLQDNGTTPRFTLLFTLIPQYGDCTATTAIRSLAAAWDVDPSVGTFCTGDDNGNVLLFSLCADLGLDRDSPPRVQPGRVLYDAR